MARVGTGANVEAPRPIASRRWRARDRAAHSARTAAGAADRCIGTATIDYRLIGWGWMLWDVDWFRPRTAERIVARIATRVGGWRYHRDARRRCSAPRKDQRQTVEATARLIPALRARGFDFGTVCQNGG